MANIDNRSRQSSAVGWFCWRSPEHRRGRSRGRATAAARCGPGTVYVIQNGKEQNRPSAVQNDLLGFAASGLDVMLTTPMDSLMLRAYVTARARGYHGSTVSVPKAVDFGNNALAFDPTRMRAACDTGTKLGRGSNSWPSTPGFIQDLAGWALEHIGSPRWPSWAALRRSQVLHRVKSMLDLQIVIDPADGTPADSVGTRWLRPRAVF